jgi:uncharacterized protein (DUF1800 family)
VDRRDVLKAGAAAAGVFALSGCSRLIAKHGAGHGLPEEILPPEDVEPNYRLVNRLSFGPRPGDVALAAQLGREQYVERQLKAEESEEPRLPMLLGRLDVNRVDSEALRDIPHAVIVDQLQQSALLRAVYGRNQLQERLADLWTNHLNIYALKKEGGYLLVSDSLKVVRKHALGKFPELVEASAKSPAMLVYLDNPLNEKGVPNENYARELMELHTLGVNGGYTQKDVMEVARCFTGWTYETRFLRPKGKFRFVPELHDNGPKEVLGHKIPAGGGVEDGERVLEILTTHPSTAKFVAQKLCLEFLGTTDTPWVDRMAKTYQQTGGDLREMLRPLLLSDDLLDSPPIVKRPLDYMASALRATDAVTACDKPVLNHLKAMGQEPYLWPMPDGFPIEPSSWTGSLLGRWNFALSLTSGGISGTEIDLKPLLAKADDRSDAHAATALVLGRRAEKGDRAVETMMKAMPAASAADAVAFCLASPAFQWR